MKKKKSTKAKISTILEELDGAGESAADHGSRNPRKRAPGGQNGDVEMLEIDDPSELAREDEPQEERSGFVTTTENFVDDDDLQESLKLARRQILQSKNKTRGISAAAAVALAARRAGEVERKEEEQQQGAGLVISATTEFIRDLGDTEQGGVQADLRPRPANGGAPQGDKQEDEIMADYTREKTPSEHGDTPPSSRGGSVEPAPVQEVSFLLVMLFFFLIFYCHFLFYFIFRLVMINCLLPSLF